MNIKISTVFINHGLCHRSCFSVSILPFFLLSLLFPAGKAISESEGTLNLVPNGDFSKSENAVPLYWECSGNPKSVTQSLKVSEIEGNQCAVLACTRFEGKTSGWDHVMAAQDGGIKLEKGKTYEFSCRARAENLVGRNVSVMIQDTDGWHPCGFSTELPLAQTWQTYKRLFKASRNVDKTARLQFWFTETGTLYLDDVRIVMLPDERIEFTEIVPDLNSKNLVPNGSFELGKAG